MRTFIKLLAHGLASVLVSPFLFLVWMERYLLHGESMFQGASQFISLIPFQFGTFLRAAFYTHACASVNREIHVGFLTLFSHTNTDIGKYVYIGPQSNIGSCEVGQDCLIGSGVHVLSGKKQHNISDSHRPYRLQGGVYQKIKIGENCWIGNHATIMADVGANSVVAAGAVVVDPVPSNSVVGGNPARVLRSP